MRRAALLVVLLVAAGSGAEELPSAAATRAAFEAQFPKTGPSAAALELERLAARIGVDLAPRLPDPPPPDEQEPSDSDSDEDAEPDWEPSPTPTPKRLLVDPWKDRTRPTSDAVRRLESVSPDLLDFVTREVASTEEWVGVPPAPLARFLAEHDATLFSIQSLLLREEALRWEVDVTGIRAEPWPNFMSHMRLQRILIARALLAMRAQSTDAAGQALEASWRLNEALLSRPEFISHLVAVVAAKQHAGALRKIEEADSRWALRLRDRRLPAGFLAAFQNQIWFLPEIDDSSGDRSVRGRVYRQVAEELQKRENCARSADEIRGVWDRAAKEQLDPGKPEHVVIMEVGVPSLVNGLERLTVYEIDAELTALVLDARQERAASPRNLWPEALRSLGQGVCPSANWKYRASGAFATVAFETPLRQAGVGLQLPLTFMAGKPAAAATPAPDGARYASLDGLRVRYKLAGPVDAPGIVLVHGWSGSMDLWREQVPALSRRYRVVTLDLPGHGGSDKPRRDYTMILFAQAIEAVMDDAGIEKAFLVGHSLGTPVVRQALRRDPRRVLGLVAVDGALRAFSTDSAFVDRFLAPYKSDRWKEAMGAFVDSSFPAGKSAAREETKAIMTATPQHVVVSAGEGMFDPEVWTDDPIEVPLLLLLAKSPFWNAEYEAYVRKLARDVDWRVFDGVGHFLMLQKPEAVNAALLDWLSRRTPAP